LIPRLGDEGPARGPLVSVLIPARNEEANIERTVRSFLAQTWDPIEIIVIDDRSTDRTGEILRSIAGARLTVMSGEETPAGWLGKPWALHQASRIARGEIFLFVDADIFYEPSAIAAAVAHLETTGAAMVTLFPRIVMRSFWERVAMPQLAMAGFTFLPTWLANRTTIPLLGIGGGVGNMVRRADYEAAGGHETLRNEVVDDVGTARMLRRTGRRTVVARADDLVSVRMYESRRAIVEGFTKNTFAAFGRSYALTILFALLGVIVHVLPYGWALTGDPLAIATVVVITMTRIALFTSLGYPLLDALWMHPLTILFWTWLSLRSMWITGVRKRLTWRGREFILSEAKDQPVRRR
jgi:chlorobactene glucosyltransferase